MPSYRRPFILVFYLAVALTGACGPSATDRLEQGIALQSRGLYMDAVYRYADAIERDDRLRDARGRLVAAGDSALTQALADAHDHELRDDPVSAAYRYRDIDRMLERIRSVGERLNAPLGYDDDRRALFDRALAWRMERGDDARAQGRWADARGAYRSARADFQPSRGQVEAALDAETALLLEWADVELEDGRPRAAFGLADEAGRVRNSAPRDVVLAVRDLQAEALERGTLVVAVPPVAARPRVRERLGAGFEIQLDEGLVLDHWTRPPPFVRLADHQVMRTQLRGVLRGVPQTPVLVGRALQAVGADLAALIELTDIEVLEQDVRRTPREGMVRDGTPGQVRAPRPVTWEVVEGNMAYRGFADVVLIDPTGREVTRFRAEGRSGGPFRRGAFDGNPDRLELDEGDRALFDPGVLADQSARVEAVLMQELAAAIASGTYDTVLGRIP